MGIATLRKSVLLMVSLASWATFASPAYANVTKTVQCSNPADEDTYRTISSGLEALARVATTGSKTLLISGTCNENVTVNGFSYLTLQGNPTATINGQDLASNVALLISDSQDIVVNNISVVGGADCDDHSLCRFNNDTFQGASTGAIEQAGFAVSFRASAVLLDCTFQNNAGSGIFVGIATRLDLLGGTVQNNPGDGISTGGFGSGTLVLQPSNTTNPIVQNNSGNGIRADVNSTVVLLGATVTGNGGDGLRLTGSSTAKIRGGSSITQNVGHGVRIGDLSFAEFSPGDTVTGNNTRAATPYDIVCDPVNAATRGFGSLTGSTTNCPAEKPINP